MEPEDGLQREYSFPQTAKSSEGRAVLAVLKTLASLKITVPLILLGPAGIYVIHVTYLRGRYEAKGNSWNEESGNTYKPAPVNLIQRTARMATAVKVFIERQGVKLPVEIEPVLIAGNPGLHIESVRPAIKVMMIDGIKPFAAGLATARPVLNLEAVREFADRIVDPRPPKKAATRTAPRCARRRKTAARKKTAARPRRTEPTAVAEVLDTFAMSESDLH